MARTKRLFSGAATIAVAAFALSACSNQKDEPITPGAVAPPAVRPAAQPAAQPVAQPAAGAIEIAVTGEGFVPAQLRAKVGQPLKLVVTRKTDKTCATEIVIKDYAINKPLPLNQPVEVVFTPTKPGPVRFACGMDMIAGSIAVE